MRIGKKTLAVVLCGYCFLTKPLQAASLSNASCDDKRLILGLVQGFNQTNYARSVGVNIIDIKDIKTVFQSENEFRCRAKFILSNSSEESLGYKWYYTSFGQLNWQFDNE